MAKRPPVPAMPRRQPAPSKASHAFRVTHSSAVPDWRTEPALFQALDDEFYFGLDAAATESSSLIKPNDRSSCQYFGPDHPQDQHKDALLVPDWTQVTGNPIFCNPPSSREQAISLEPWLAKFVDQARLGATVVALVPHKTSTAWWRYCRQAVEIREIPYRVKFWLPEQELAVINDARGVLGKPPIKSGDSAGFDSAVVIFRPQPGVIPPATPRVVTWSYR